MRFPWHALPGIWHVRAVLVFVAAERDAEVGVVSVRQRPRADVGADVVVFRVAPRAQVVCVGRIKEHRRPPSVVDSLSPIEEAVGDVLGASGETDVVTSALSRLETRNYSPNATIVRRGDAAEEFFIAARGP